MAADQLERSWKKEKIVAQSTNLMAFKHFFGELQVAKNGGGLHAICGSFKFSAVLIILICHYCFEGELLSSMDHGTGI